MRHFAIGALALLTLGAVHGADLGTTPDIALNGGFEEGDSARAATWGLWPPTGRDEGVSSERDAEVKRSGESSGRLRIANPDFEGVATWHHRATPVEPGQEIVLQFWMKAEDVVGRCAVDVQLRQGEQKIVGSRATQSWKGTLDWREITHRFTIPPEADHICLVPLLEGLGTVWFDDIQCWATPRHEARRAEPPPQIDGDLSDVAWQAAPELGPFALADGSGLPERGTVAKMLYDDRALYFALRCELKPGDRLIQNITERDGAVWRDDDIEVFLNPQGDRGAYHQFVVNPRGAQYDSRGVDPGWTADWQAQAKVGEEAWTVEVAIPFAELPLGLDVSDSWCVNVGRVDRMAAEASCWSATFSGFHAPGRLGRVTGLTAAALVDAYKREAAGRLADVRKRYEGMMANLDMSRLPARWADPLRQQTGKIAGDLGAVTALLRGPEQVTQEQWMSLPGRFAALDRGLRELGQSSVRAVLFARWREKLGRDPRFGTALAGPMQKVLRDGKGLDRALDRLDLSSARNEYEGGQILVFNLSDQKLTDVRVEASDFERPGGPRLSREHVKLSVVGYVKTAKPNYKTSHVGYWPDPLLPHVPFSVEPGEVQPIWLRVYVPPDQLAGDYKGTITVTCGEETQAADIGLTVYAFGLPRRGHLATPFGCGPDTLSQWYTASPNYQENLPPEVFTRWNQFMLDYRLSPTRVGQSYVRETYDETGLPQLDFTVSDQTTAAVADRLPPQSINMAGVGHFGWHAAKGAKMLYGDDAHTGRRAGLAQWPKTESWASLARPISGALLAERKCTGFSFWAKSASPELEGESITLFVNCFPNRWITGFKLPGAEWQRITVPLASYRHNTRGGQITPEELKTVGNFQFVIANKARPISFLVDDLVAQCPDGDLVLDDFELTSELREITAKVGALCAHWKQRGWFEYGHVYGWDEVRPEEYEPVIDAYRKVLQIVPDAPIMQTYYTNRQPNELIGTVKIWCAITSVYDEEFCEARRRAGEPIWLYVCCGPTPPFANFFIDQPAIDHRILFWQAWQRHATGFLYWRVNYWHGMLPLEPGQALWPEVEWDNEKLATYTEFKVNGDGWLIYPGEDFEPLSSIRMECVRDGIEDYEYLWLLRDLIDRVRADGRQDRRVVEAERLLTVGGELSESFTSFTKDPQQIAQRRLQIAQAIETLQELVR